MRSSRAVGIVGASTIVCAALYEISKFLTALSVNEGSVGIEAIRKEVYLAGNGVCVVITATFRIVVLTVRLKWFGWQLVSWFLLFSSLCLYFWLSRPPNTPPICDENGVCFGVYDMHSYTNFVSITGTFYILLSVLRVLFTSAYVLGRQRIK
jgi:hypothetical protein